MKVLHVNTWLDQKAGGGTAERVFRLCQELESTGIHNRILTTGSVSDARLRELNPTLVTVLPLMIARYQIPVLHTSAIREAVNWADVVHIVGHWAAVNVLAFLAAQRISRPYIVCPAGAIPPFGRSMWLKAGFDAIWGRRLITGAAKGVAVASTEIEALNAYGLPSDRIVVIPNGVVLNSGEVLQPKLVPKRPFVLFLGRLSYIKGPDLLLQAFLQIAGQFPNVDLVLAGPDDDMAEKLKRTANESAVGHRIRFPGYVRGIEKSNLLTSASLLAIPSRREAMSIVALEAGAAGTPVIVTDQCGFDQIGAHGGLVVEASVEALSAGISDLLGQEDSLRQRGQSLFRYIQSEYSWSRAASLYADLFNSVLAARTGNL